ncbi:hypothetical protein B0T24DRAFT_643541 [Lasiosphaeria ovina]|uniref:Uncharacterized protein n=1 Tax=Lasiosphaeria ovina TaxID=92902 RepID=A0AAE0MYZ3_9PEZI|nr:hypothetical protein B0T24DRAFT_643541 [Lasiosphaeria ovina]
MLAPFERKSVGAVGTCQRTRRIEVGSIAERITDWIMFADYIERRHFENSATLAIDKSISCLACPDEWQLFEPVLSSTQNSSQGLGRRGGAGGSSTLMTTTFGHDGSCNPTGRWGINATNAARLRRHLNLVCSSSRRESYRGREATGGAIGRASAK